MKKDRWLACDEPRLLLGSLRAAGLLSGRKRRLLLCALARALWPALADERSRRAVEEAEAFADGDGGLDSLWAAAAAARQAHDEVCSAFIEARRATRGKYRRHVKEAAARADALAVAAWAAADEPLGFWNSTTECGGDPLGFYDEGAAVDSLLGQHHTLVLELFGDPFSAPCLEPAWLAFGGGVVPKLARAIYESRRFEELPVLADALEESGCGDEGLLAHLRGPGPHARGCHVLDLLLGGADR